MDQERSSIREVALLLIRLGVIGFGGPAAHIAMMRDEVVRRRRWMTDGEFLEWVGATNLVPGPNSTELAIHIGHRRAGWRGLVLAGVCFILPAVVIVSVIAAAYARYGTDPSVVDVRYGVLPVIIAIVAYAVVGLGRSTWVDRTGRVVVPASFVAYLIGVHELVVLLLAGVAVAAWSQRDRFVGRLRSTSAGALVAAAAGAGQPVSLWRLFVAFLEIGSVLYGSGYVLLAFLQRILVDDLGWLTGEQVLDAVAIGQITPGPVFTTATFVGWQVGGVAGAAVSTIGIFAPSFLFVAVLGRVVAWMQRRPIARAFLRGVTAASLGLMAGVLVDLAGDALVDPLTVAVALLALGVLVWTDVNSAWLIAGGVAIGLVRVLAR